MSHDATKWAFDQPELHKDMKPSELAVLLVLADCHNPVHGCFPSQDYIRAKTNLSERAVRDQLAKLRDRGLIDWDAFREDGRRGSNRYRLGFEDDFLPAKSAGRPTGKIEQELPANSCKSYRQNLPPNLVRDNRKREPVIEHSSLRSECRQSDPELDLDNSPNPQKPESPEPDETSQAFEDYNAVAERHGWPKAVKLTTARRSKLRSRLRDAGGLAGWRAALDRAGRSAFCTGHNASGWRADLDFLLQEKSFTRLVEGGYDDRKPKGNFCDIAKPAMTSAGFSQRAGGANWPFRLEQFSKGAWSDTWGPKPGEPGYQGPPISTTTSKGASQ